MNVKKIKRKKRCICCGNKWLLNSQWLNTYNFISCQGLRLWEVGHPLGQLSSAKLLSDTDALTTWSCQLNVYLPGLLQQEKRNWKSMESSILTPKCFQPICDTPHLCKCPTQWSSLVSQWLKDLVLSLLWLRLFPWCGLDPWPGNFCVPRVCQKKEREKEKKKKRCFLDLPLDKTKKQILSYLKTKALENMVVTHGFLVISKWRGRNWEKWISHLEWIVY